LRTIRGAVIIRFKYKIAEELNIHIRNWFREDKLPDPRQSRFTQVKLKPGLFMPELHLAVLIGYVEKYRKYLYPMMFDLKNQTCYLTGQPIYYNHDQWPMINQESLIILHNTTPKFERIDKISHDSNSDEMNSETHSNESSNETNSNESSNETNSNELNSKIIEDNFIFSSAKNLISKSKPILSGLWDYSSFNDKFLDKTILQITYYVAMVLTTNLYQKLPFIPHAP